MRQKLRSHGGLANSLKKGLDKHRRNGYILLKIRAALNLLKISVIHIKEVIEKRTPRSQVVRHNIENAFLYGRGA